MRLVITDRAVTRGPEWRAFDAKGRTRNSVKPGAEILIIMKNDQRTGNLTRGTVKDILTNSPTHPHGIKV